MDSSSLSSSDDDPDKTLNKTRRDKGWVEFGEKDSPPPPTNVSDSDEFSDDDASLSANRKNAGWKEFGVKDAPPPARRSWKAKSNSNSEAELNNTTKGSNNTSEIFESTPIVNTHERKKYKKQIDFGVMTPIPRSTTPAHIRTISREKSGGYIPAPPPPQKKKSEKQTATTSSAPKKKPQTKSFTDRIMKDLSPDTSTEQSPITVIPVRRSSTSIQRGVSSQPQLSQDMNPSQLYGTVIQSSSVASTAVSTAPSRHRSVTSVGRSSSQPGVSSQPQLSQDMNPSQLNGTMTQSSSVAALSGRSSTSPVVVPLRSSARSPIRRGATGRRAKSTDPPKAPEKVPTAASDHSPSRRRSATPSKSRSPVIRRSSVALPFRRSSVQDMNPSQLDDTAPDSSNVASTSALSGPSHRHAASSPVVLPGRSAARSPIRPGATALRTKGPDPPKAPEKVPTAARDHSPSHHRSVTPSKSRSPRPRGSSPKTSSVVIPLQRSPIRPGATKRRANNPDPPKSPEKMPTAARDHSPSHRRSVTPSKSRSPRSSRKTTSVVIPLRRSSVMGRGGSSQTSFRVGQDMNSSQLDENVPQSSSPSVASAAVSSAPSRRRSSTSPVVVPLRSSARSPIRRGATGRRAKNPDPHKSPENVPTASKEHASSRRRFVSPSKSRSPRPRRSSRKTSPVVIPPRRSSIRHGPSSQASFGQDMDPSQLDGNVTQSSSTASKPASSAPSRRHAAASPVVLPSSSAARSPIRPGATKRRAKNPDPPKSPEKMPTAARKHRLASPTRDPTPPRKKLRKENEQLLSNQNLIPKKLIANHLFFTNKDKTKQEIDEIHSGFNRYAEKFLDRLCSGTTQPDGMFTFKELEKALQVEGLIGTGKSELVGHFLDTFTADQYKRIKGILIPATGDTDTFMN